MKRNEFLIDLQAKSTTVDIKIKQSGLRVSKFAALDQWMGKNPGNLLKKKQHYFLRF